MRKFIVLSLILLVAVVFGMGDASAAKKSKGPQPVKVNGVSRINSSGDLTGVVACSEAEGLPEGALVYIPGKPFMAITDAGGSFTFYNVPQGDYTVKVETDYGVQDLGTASVTRKIVNTMVVSPVFCVAPEPEPTE
ncbi:MAG: hypothetical protein AB2L11_13675 [Syntrophobacteraceae bacterium]